MNEPLLKEANHIRAVRTWLLADAPIAELVEGDVFGNAMAGDILDRGPKRALVVKKAGGTSMTGGSYAEFDTKVFDLIAYGSTAEEADDLILMAAPRLYSVEREVVGDTLIHWINRAGGEGGARDGQTQWPQAFRSFQILYSLRPVA